MEEKAEELKEKATAIELAKAEKKAKIEKVKLALESASQNENLRIVLVFLMELCDYRGNPMAFTASGDVSRDATMHNVGRQSIYRDLAKLMSAETENLIERREK